MTPDNKPPQNWIILPITYQPDTEDSRKESGLEYAKYYHHSAYDAMAAKLERLEAASAGLVKTLESCKGAMTYAYEDHTDQYYLNVKNLIEASVAAYKLATEKEK